MFFLITHPLFEKIELTVYMRGLKLIIEERIIWSLLSLVTCDSLKLREVR